jgi:flagellar protein FliS
MDARSQYREADARGSSPVRLVVLLYEQAIQDLRRAAIAVKKGEIEVRTQAINHALLVICHLQGTLDRERGGEVGRNLDRFYNCMRDQLTQAQILMSEDILHQQISGLLSLRDAWIEVDNAMENFSPQAANLNSARSDRDQRRDTGGNEGFSSEQNVSRSWEG